MKELIILSGFPGSGKTTWCRNKLSDYIRVSLYDLIKMVGGNKKVAKKLEVKSIEKSLSMGFNVVVDRVNLTERRRKKLIDIARRENASVKCIYLDISEDIWRKRNNKRMVEDEDIAPMVSEEKIRKMKMEFQKPDINEGFDDLIIISS